MPDASFQIFVSDYSASVDEWRRAQEAPASDLPRLRDEQKEVARKFGITEEEYARGVLAGLLGQERQRERAKRLGEVVQRILEDLETHYRVVGVSAQMFKGRWLLQVQSASRTVNIAVPRELGDDVLDSGVREEIEELRRRVLYGLGLAESRRDSQ